MSGVLGQPLPNGEDRAEQSLELRDEAAALAPSRGLATPRANGEELRYGDTFAANYHKGFAHDPFGFVNAADYRDYVQALLEQDHRAFETLPVGANTGGRKLTSPFAGHSYDLEGLDAAATSLDGAPLLASDELAAEMAELYAMALLRDQRFNDIENGGAPQTISIVNALAGMPWFSAGNTQPRARRIASASDLFRGSTPGSRNGPWMSQYLLIGNELPSSLTVGSNTEPCAKVKVSRLDGYVFYGTQVIDQRSIVAKEGKDWMQNWPDWLKVQNGDNPGLVDNLEGDRRFLSTPRDIATYVHFDALYQAYHVACNFMLGKDHGSGDFAFDRGLPTSNSRTRAGFANFGGPHVLALLAEVSTRALKAVWRQKWLVHRRLRPEAAAGLITLVANAPNEIGNRSPRLLQDLQTLLGKIPASLLSDISQLNGKLKLPGSGNNAPNYLLPMAFPEGSPTHPAYGAGHATVAGACVTVLKAFFEMYEADGVTEKDWPVKPVVYGKGKSLVKLTGQKLKIQGELDKLAANIAIARNMAGVHYYTDYYASVRQGERVTVSILQDQIAGYNEPVSMSFTSFDGDRIRVSGQGGRAHLSVIDDDGHSVDPQAWFQRYG